jgi:hypothetical protein
MFSSEFELGTSGADKCVLCTFSVLQEITGYSTVKTLLYAMDG